MTYLGIDLDNTLIDYESVFPAAANKLNIALPPSIQTKQQIREFLRLQADGEESWQRLQGAAYGKFVKDYAKLFPGVKRFFWRCVQNGNKVKVVSHKTEFGHMDKDKIPLRQVALEFLEKESLVSKDNPSMCEVIFKNTCEDKISYIAENNFDWFIDDLPEVVSALAKLEKVKVIHFSQIVEPENKTGNNRIISLSDWQQIDALINGDWALAEINKLLKRILMEEAKEIEKNSSGGNSATYRLTMQDRRTLKLKVYPIDKNHDRLASEYAATMYISKNHSNYVNKPLGRDDELGIGIYEWIEGTAVTNINDNDINSCVKFLDALHSMREESQFDDFPLASAACLSGSDIERQINYRLNKFLDSNIDSNELELFLKNKLIPISRKIIDWSINKWPEDTAFNIQIPRSQQILSPSDFGFHNSVRHADGTLAFLDFEYFGWDDPVKLISDFSFHPGMNLSNEQVAYWTKTSLELYGNHLSQRLRVCRPLYGLIWCLILLNDFNPQVWHRRLLAKGMIQSCRQNKLASQLTKAELLLDNISANYREITWETCH